MEAAAEHNKSLKKHTSQVFHFFLHISKNILCSIWCFKKIYINVLIEFTVVVIKAIGMQYFGHLIGEKQYEQAAALCRKILGKNKELWEEHICCFGQIQQIGVCYAESLWF